MSARSVAEDIVMQVRKQTPAGDALPKRFAVGLVEARDYVEQAITAALLAERERNAATVERLSETGCSARLIANTIREIEEG